MRARRVAGYVGIGLGITVVLLLAGLLILTRSDWGREQVRSFALDRIEGALDGQVEIGRIEGNLLREARLLDVAIRDVQGRPFVEADTLALHFSLRALLSQRIELADVRVVNAAVVLDRPPGEDWNYARIFRIDPDSVERGPPGWGEWVALDDVEVVNSRVAVRTAWEPAEDLTSAERAAALRSALAGDAREHVVEVPGGYQNVMEFSELNVVLPRILVAHPDTAGIPFEIARMDGLVRPFSPPAARVHELAGTFRLVRDSLMMSDVRAALTGTRLTGGGVYSLHSGDLLLHARGDPVAFADLRWVYPSLPEQGGGTMTMTLELGNATDRIVVRDLDAAIGDATVAGRVDITTGDTLRFGETDLRFTQMPTHIVERFVDFAAPRRGLLTGRLALRGLPHSLRVDSDVRFDDAAGASSRVIADGGLGVDPDLRFRELRLQFAPLQAELARAVMPDLPLRGTVEGTALLTGSLTTLELDADLALRDPRHGLSRVHATGGIDTRQELQLRQMHVRMDPLRTSLLREWVPDLPLAGTLAGTATLNGFPAARITVSGDIVHEQSGERSHVIGRAEVVRGGRTRADVDVRLQPLSLTTAGRFVPAARLRGSVAGRLRASGDLGALQLDADLSAPDGGAIRATGTLDLAATDPGYDVDARLTGFDFSAVTLHSPAQTDLSGPVTARGRGVDPATMRAVIAADLEDIGIDDIAADRVRLRLGFEAGLLRADSSLIRIAGADAVFDGSFGLVADRHGELAYRIRVDSLHALAPLLPGTDTAVTPRARPSLTATPGAPQESVASSVPAAPDTAAVRELPRPRDLRASRRYVAADGAQVTVNTTLVQSSIEREDRNRGRLADLDADGPNTDTGVPETASADSLQGVTPVHEAPADSVAGRLYANGTLQGNIAAFTVDGRAVAEDLLYRGMYIGSGTADYDLAGVGTSSPEIDVDADLQDVRAVNLAFDTVTVRGRYQGIRGDGVGAAVIAAKALDDTEYRADVEFSLSLPRSELRIAELMLRFDTVTWQTVQPGAVSWGSDTVELTGIDMVSDAGGRILLNGQMPADGTGDLEVAIEDLQVAQLVTLLQLDNAIEGRLHVDAHVQGTLTAPRMTGTSRLEDARLDGETVPDIHTSFDYADQLLTANAELLHGQRQVAVAEASLPLDLALTAVTQRLIDGELVIDVRADSLPVEAIPGLAAQVDDVRGHVRGEIAVRGTLKAPALAGDIDVDLISVRVVPTNVRFDSVSGRLRLADNVVQIDSLVGRSGGPVRVNGEIGLATLTQPTFALAVAARQALVVDTDDARLRVDADLTVGGTMARIEVGGEVRTRSGVIWIPRLDELGALRTVSLHAPATFERLETAFTEERLALDRQRPLLDRLHLDVAVVVDRDVWLRSTEANVEIYTPQAAGPLRIRMAGRETGFALEGTINTDRGEYEFMSRRFNLTRGAATFVAEPVINPILQIAAQHEVRLPGREAFDMRVLIGGTMRDVEITLESTAQPPIAQTDLLSYLALGRDASGLLHRQGSALSGQGGDAGELVGNVAGLATYQLGTIALDVLVSDLEAELIRELGVDVFRITPADLPPDMFTGRYIDVLRSTEIEAGRYLSPRLFVAGQLTSSLARPGVRVEYMTPFGVQWLTSWTARWLATEPTLTDRDVRRAGVLGSFLSREWRF